jgi:hypothetical protein
MQQKKEAIRHNYVAIKLGGTIMKMNSIALMCALLIALTGCTGKDNSPVAPSPTQVAPFYEAVAKIEVFTEGQAIQIALKTDKGSSVNFPTTPGTKKVEATIGGKSGTTKNLELTTKVEKKSNDTFVVTFVKDWNIKVGNKEAISYWEYQVNSKGATLLKSEDNENLIAIIK